MRPLTFIIAMHVSALSPFAFGCGDDGGGGSPAPDAGSGADASGGSDAGADAADAGGTEDAGNGDAGGSGCIQATASTWLLFGQDDVSVMYTAALDPSIENQRLGVLFERYVPGPDVGTFELGTGQDANFGGCAHCVHILLSPEHGYFADRGTLITRTDPYSQRLDMTLENVRLVEVTIDLATRSSTPVPDGECIELAEVNVSGVFPPDGWYCDPEDYYDGEACHCSCGAFDPDCAESTVGNCAPFEPGCQVTPAQPLVDCDPGQVCGFDPIEAAPECTTTCDWTAREGCAEGTCVFTFGVTEEDTCISRTEQIDPAVIGEECEVTFLQKVCNVVDGFAQGFCGPDQLCRPTCTSNAECDEASGETCRFFLFDGQVGYCGPEPIDTDG